MKSIRQHIFEKLKVTMVPNLSFDFQSILNCKNESEFTKKVIELKDYLNNLYEPLDCTFIDSKKCYVLDSKYTNSGPFVCANDIIKIIYVGMYDANLYKIYFTNNSVFVKRFQPWKRVSQEEGFDSILLSNKDMQNGNVIFEIPDELINSYETLIKQN